MKLLTTLTLGLITTISLNAQTTMCFKENHASMATIETIPLDGGECSSKKSVKDMKNEGWNIDDIKIEKTSDSKSNYIYIFKKENVSLSSLDEDKLEQRIMQRLETRKKAEIETKKRNIKIKMSKDGKNLYIKTCQKCHGEKADIKAHNTSRPLIDMSLQDMRLSIRDYMVGDYDRGRAFIMKPYASMLVTNDIKNIYSYIQTLKPKEELEKEDKSEESK